MFKPAREKSRINIAKLGLTIDDYKINFTWCNSTSILSFFTGITLSSHLYENSSHTILIVNKVN